MSRYYHLPPPQFSAAFNCGISSSTKSESKNFHQNIWRRKKYLNTSPLIPNPSLNPNPKMTFCRSQTVEEDGLVSPHTAPPHPSPAVPLPTPAGDQHPPNFFQNFQPDKTDLSIFRSQYNTICQFVVDQICCLGMQHPKALLLCLLAHLSRGFNVTLN